MPKTAKRIVLVVAVFIVVVFAIFLFNQTMQIVQSARAVNSVFGNGVMWGLIPPWTPWTPSEFYEDIEAALQTLDKHADDVVTSTASAVFLSTAVLQSGRLDVLVVFAAQ
jgi:hypothetical protein